MLTAIVGVNWGDEGKGRMVDLLSQRYGVVARYQGGNNAGHTVVNDKGKFILNLLPSGILRPEVVNVMGNGMVIDLEHLVGEIGKLRGAGIRITPENLKISSRAVVCLPWHVQQDGLEEDRLGEAKYGSTRRGIAPVYGDKYLKKAIHMGDLADEAALRETLRGLVEWKNLTLRAYGAGEATVEGVLAWLREYGEPLLPYVCDTGAFLDAAARRRENILFEAQLGALRDIDFGIYPYTSSSSTLAAYAPIGAGVPGRKLDETVGIMKAYSSCVGEGPFTAEWFGAEAEALRERRRIRRGHGEASARGTLRRGGLPLRRQGAGRGLPRRHEARRALLYGEDPRLHGHEVDGNRVTEFPSGAALLRAKPVFEYLPGWKKDIGGCRAEQELPRAAREYVRYLQDRSVAPSVTCPSAPSAATTCSWTRASEKRRGRRVGTGGTPWRKKADRMRPATRPSMRGCGNWSGKTSFSGGSWRRTNLSRAPSSR
jgi:adenylosuccinate synthase